uniref:Uncharacterized protein n=1 Tax=Peronospora matthiolae TaxID=2874970 RepID=A0AAV1USJ9_9STRA
MRVVLCTPGISCLIFTLRRSLHNPIQLRKQLREYVMTPGDHIMERFLKFEDSSTRLVSVVDDVFEEEKWIISLGSLSPEYDAIVWIIEAREHTNFSETKNDATARV